jgi:PKD repeat protein
MKYLATYLFGFLLLNGHLIAQQIPCFFDEYTNDERLADTERKIQKGVAELMVGNRNMDSVKVVPIVVHVIHNGGSENISEVQILSQIEVLNEDYGKLPGTNGDGNGVDTEVRFSLANLDPDGRCTNGIVRVKSPLANHQTYQRALLKELSFWDNNRYLNIYVVKSINGNVAGYSSFPGGPPEEDGMVVRHTYFGNIGTASNSLGRTTSHEIGHWFGLYHTFNNACGTDVCSDGDYVCDTPPALEPNFNCSTKNTCHNDMPDVNDLKENYMDYTPDACKNMFTEGQKMRMQATLNDIRTGIWSDGNLLSTGYDSVFTPPAVCPVAANFVTLTRDICFGNSVNFMDISLNEATEWQWYFPGGNPSASNEPNPTIAYDSIGIYDVTLVVSDGNTTDSLTLENYINVGMPGIGDALFYAEDFDDGLYPPTGVTLNNPDGEITWELDSLAFTSAPYSIRINNLINTNYGTVDEIIMPFFDFTSVSPDSMLYMSFDWAYAKSDPSFSDELLVLLSTDCGTNFDQVFYKAGNALTTGPTQTTPFVPDSSQWKSAFINLDDYKGETYVQVKIVNVTDGGNNLYLDGLYIGNGSELVSSVEGLTNVEGVKVYPNPTAGLIQIEYTLEASEEVAISLLDLNGKSVCQAKPILQMPGIHQQTFDLHELGLPMGIYLVKIKTSEGQAVQKLTFVAQK